LHQLQRAKARISAQQRRRIDQTRCHRQGTLKLLFTRRQSAAPGGSMPTRM
jgi:hypothetical protein